MGRDYSAITQRRYLWPLIDLAAVILWTARDHALRQEARHPVTARRRAYARRTRNWGLGACLIPTWHRSDPTTVLGYSLSVQLGPIILDAVIWRRRNITTN